MFYPAFGRETRHMRDLLNEVSSRSRNSRIDDFELDIDVDYELADDNPKYKTLTDDTVILFTKTYRPELNDSMQVCWSRKTWSNDS